ncbi:uncharacterized protein PGTG_06983 [Puccinia graminis f. sp. tritici CRL 75-36-700-3]|uniref:Uncharacterized protein n=1 Tax=Puccinia graminis f. sp. tritici (strain CRL 75-36-700-3 / race SCCL) TaxID=418459 RepID=E3KAX2_PUCGT|nr:uncharacterized protein PGTG_06983 [Puccinia graminis f. sp. tritici CRL 75-36-700-3]EFP81362.2 hypothetical protein PGTG_06983 [Puccinia graminis f. sp. tritici CRL 75-36-700-3]
MSNNPHHNSFHPSCPPNSNHTNRDSSAGGYYYPPNIEQLSYVDIIYNEQPNIDFQPHFDSSPIQYATGQHASHADLNNNYTYHLNNDQSPSQSQVTHTQPTQLQTIIYQPTQSTHLATQPQSQPFVQHRSRQSAPDTPRGPVCPLPAPSQANGSLAHLLINTTAHDPAPLNPVHRISANPNAHDPAPLNPVHRFSATVNPTQCNPATTIPIQPNPSVAARVDTVRVDNRQAGCNQSRSPSSYWPSVSPSRSLPPPLPSPILKRPAPPLIDINNRPDNRKRKKIQPVDCPRPSPRPYEELMKMSEGQLIMEAKKWSKKAMSDSDRSFFAHYASEQRKMLTIKAIERGVSMPMVHSFLGRRLALRKPSNFNYFMQTKKVRAVFQGARKGVKYSPAMGLASKLWHKLSPEEKAKYRHSAMVTTDDASDENGLAGNSSDRNQVATDSSAPNGPVADNEANSQGSAVEEASDDDEPNGGANQVGMRKNISLHSASKEVENFMDEWDAKAVNVANTFGCELVTFAVSRHLGRHSFQFTRCTPGAIQFVQGAKDVDGAKAYPARMQSFITGYTVADLAAVISRAKEEAAKAAKNGTAVPRSAPLHPISAVARMSLLIAEKTQGAIKQWPWTDTDFSLAQTKHRLILLPGAQIQEAWLKRPSRGLGTKRQGVLHVALDSQLIDIVYDPSIPDRISRKDFKSPPPATPSRSSRSSQSPDGGSDCVSPSPF